MRCPYCGCDKLYLDKRSDGYSVKKGIAGAVVLGPVGAIAGINGKEKQVFHCPLCGGDASEPMNFQTSDAIRKAITCKDTVKLREFKVKYPNIEWNETLSPNLNKPPKQPQKEVIKSLDEIRLEMREYISKYFPITYKDIQLKFLSYDNTGHTVKDTLLTLCGEGLVKKIGEYFVPVTNIEEVIRNKTRGAQIRREIQDSLIEEKRKAEDAAVKKVKEIKQQQKEEYCKLLEQYKDEYLHFLRENYSLYSIQPLIDEYNEMINNKEDMIAKELKKIRKQNEEVKISIKEKQIVCDDICKKRDEINNIIEQKKQQARSVSFFKGKIKKQLLSDVSQLETEQNSYQKEFDEINNEIKSLNETITSEEEVNSIINHMIDLKKKEIEKQRTAPNYDAIQYITEHFPDLINKIEAGDLYQDHYRKWLVIHHPKKELDNEAREDFYSQFIEDLRKLHEDVNDVEFKEKNPHYEMVYNLSNLRNVQILRFLAERGDISSYLSEDGKKLYYA